MAEKSAKTARVQAVKNENKCSNFGCYAINGKEAYGVKTKDDQQVSTIYYFPDFQKPYTKTYKVGKGYLGHGNGMCCAEKYIFFTCWVRKAEAGKQQKYLRRVKYGKLTDNLTNSIKITVPEATSGITFYKKSHLIIKQSSVDGYLTFRMGKIVINEDGKAGNFETVWTIHVKNTTGFSTGQDIYYDTKTDCLFLPFCDLANCNNKIMVVNLSGAYEMHKGNKLYTPQDTIVINKKGKYTKYEVESVAITADREMLMAVNIKKLGADREDDAVEKISNIKF